MRKTAFLTVCLVFAATFAVGAQGSDFPKLSGPYLGQKPPGMTPEVFAPGIVSSEGAREFSGTFSPDGLEYYFFRFGADSHLMVSRLAGNVWTEPRPAEFDSEFIDNEPHITGDNRIFFFCSNRPYPGSGEGRRMTQVWMMKREGNAWGAPRHLLMGMSPSSSAHGNIFIGSTIYKLTAEDRLIESGRLRPDPSVPEAEWLPHQHTCMSPDESFHLFDFKEKLYVPLSLFLPSRRHLLGLGRNP